MAIFSKKTCCVCGKPTGALMGYALTDGILCGDCYDQCSPHLPPLRQLSAEAIRKHLKYRKANEPLVEAYRPDLILGMGRGLQVTAIRKEGSSPSPSKAISTTKKLTFSATTR